MNADNSAIDPYPFSSNVNLDTKYVFDKTISSGAAITNMANRKITWETTTSTDIGIDATLFGKLNITADYFYKVTDDILMKLNVPLIIGMDAPSQNAGKMENRGWEVSVSYADQVGDFNYRASFNISDVRNKILDMRGVNQTGLTVNREGYEMYSIYGLEAIGYIQPEDYDADGNYLGATQYGNFGPGDIKYKDVNGDGVINDGDKVAIGATTKPNLIYGFGISAQWKGFDFNVHFQGAGKSSFFINGSTVFAFKDSQWGNVLGNLVANRWVDADTAAKLGIPANEDPNASYPRLSYGGNDNNQQKSTFWLKNGSYLRLKTLEVGYTLPKFNNIRVFFIGTNLLTFAKFKEWDPELGSSTGAEYPLSRVMTLGLTVNI